jgi:hypothetical protein
MGGCPSCAAYMKLLSFEYNQPAQRMDIYLFKSKTPGDVLTVYINGTEFTGDVDSNLLTNGETLVSFNQLLSGASDVILLTLTNSSTRQTVGTQFVYNR